MGQIETMIFDMDGVIIDSEPIHMKIENELFQELGLEITKEEHARFVGTSAREMWEKITREYKPEVDPDIILQKKKKRYLDQLANFDNLTPLDGIRELIEHLLDDGKKLVLASSSSREEINIVLDKLSLKKYFAVCISGAELERSKPDPEIFLKAASLIKSEPRRCCVIEDSENGVRAAKSAGMKCIGFRNPNSGNQDLSDADIIIDNFKTINFNRVLGEITS